MATHEFADRQVRVKVPPSLQITERDESTRALPSLSGFALADVTEQLQRSGFEIVANLDVQIAPRAGDLPRALDPATVEVTVAPDQASVVLTERDGAWSWHLPVRGGPGMPASRSLNGPSVETFAVRSLPGAALVLRFVAPLISGLAIKFLERDVAERLVHLAPADPNSWSPIDSLDHLNLPADPQILLLVHGTFSSTEGAYAGFVDTDGPGRAFLDRALEKYDAVLGFDHRTLSVDPMANAEDLFGRLCAHAPAGTSIDVISHSRGGLVVRALVERVLPSRQWAGKVDRVVFVGVPNAGTNFAEPDRWSAFVDLYTNLLMATSPTGAILGAGMKGLGALVKYLAAYFVDGGGVPGLAAMEPDGEFLDELNARQVGPSEPVRPWFSVTSDFHLNLDAGIVAPSELPSAVASWLESVVDNLLDDANDLVVDTVSMTAIDERPGGLVRDSLDFGVNSLVYHLNYFTQPEVAAALQAWLIDRRDRWRAEEAAMSADDVFEGTVISGGGGFNVDFDVREIDRRPTEILIDADEDRVPTQPPPPSEPVQAHVRAEMTSKITVGEPITVRTLLSRNEIEISPDTITASDGPFDMLAQETLTVELKLKQNLTVSDGKVTDRIGLPAGSGVSVVEFEVVPTAAGPVQLTVLLRRQSGEIAANLTLSGEARDAGDPDRRRRMIRAQVAAAAESSIGLDDAVWLEIWAVDGPDFIQFQYELRLPGPTPTLHFESPKLENHKAFVADLFARIEREWTLNADQPLEFRKFLQTRGSDLFERLFPEEMQAKLWELRDELKSILLLADEPYFPWEIVHLKPPTGPRQEKPRFLAQYGLLRWQFLPFPPKPELRARKGKVFSLCPQRVDPRFLLVESIAEAKYLADELGATDLRASTTAVRRLLRSGDFDVLHFSGHGWAETTDIAEALIMLDDRKVKGNFVRQFLSATTVAETAKLAGPDSTGPLVVLNACQAGRGAVQLSSLGGFARAFLAAGAQAFVACLWSVEQQPSRIFTQALYDQLLAGLPLGEAVLRARDAARDDEKAATWLAYVVYGRPDAKLVLQ